MCSRRGLRRDEAARKIRRLRPSCRTSTRKSSAMRAPVLRPTSRRCAGSTRPRAAEPSQRPAKGRWCSSSIVVPCADAPIGASVRVAPPSFGRPPVRCRCPPDLDSLHAVLAYEGGARQIDRRAQVSERPGRPGSAGRSDGRRVACRPVVTWMPDHVGTVAHGGVSTRPSCWRSRCGEGRAALSADARAQPGCAADRTRPRRSTRRSRRCEPPASSTASRSCSSMTS